MTEKDIFIKIVDYEVFSNDLRKRLLNVFGYCRKILAVFY